MGIIDEYNLSLFYDVEIESYDSNDQSFSFQSSIHYTSLSFYHVEIELYFGIDGTFFLLHVVEMITQKFIIIILTLPSCLSTLPFFLPTIFVRLKF
jgi:hypothetical protein